MKLSEFKEQYHWMNGLSEYFDFNGQSGRWENIHKALYHDNWYRKRDVMIDLANMPNSNPAHVKAWMNVLLHEQLDDVEIKPQLVATLFRKYMFEDPFLVNICKFINYWADGDKAAEMPDMNDFLSRGQVKSKLWLVSELAKVVDGPIGNVVFYGGWYNFIAHMLFAQFDVSKIWSLDLDQNVIEPSKRLYPNEVKEEKFTPITTDVNKIRWNDKNMLTYSADLEQKHKDAGKLLPQDIYDNSFIDRGKIHLVINTSCEHMDTSWYENLPTGTFVLLHQNDYFSNEQHVNCCKDVEDVKKKYPMQSILYEGALDTHLYNRFMLIGVK
tara:strand:- start:1125 stop:2105 length:981 start_codon:yes stop_codon:yes gene_type:complete